MTGQKRPRALFLLHCYAGQPLNVLQGADFYVFGWVGNGYHIGVAFLPKLVVITFYPHQFPTVRLEQADYVGAFQASSILVALGGYSNH
jgi:hypothetical protein